MAFTAGFSVNVGDPTKASDVDVLAANDDYLKNAIDTFIANDANNRVLTGTGSGTANAETNLTFDGSTLTVTGTVSATTFSGNVTGNLTGDVTGNISGNVTGGTISGTTGTFTGALSAQTLTANNGTLYLDDNGSHNGLINVPASLFLNIDSDNGATNEKFQIAKDRSGTSGGTVLFELGEDGDLAVDTDTLFVDASADRVGIGTASPSALAHLYSNNSGSNTELRIEHNNASGTATAVMRFKRAGADFAYVGGAATAISGASSTDLGLTVPSGKNIVFATANTERARITSDGNFEVTKSGPGEGLAKFESNDDLSIKLKSTFSASNGAGIYIEHEDAYTSTTNAFQAGIPQGDTNYAIGYGGIGGFLAANSLVTVMSAGNVGIGSQSPTYKLVVSNGGAAGYEFNVNGLNSGVNTVVYNRSTSAYVDSAHFALNYYIFTGSIPAEVLRATSAGEVWIKNTSDQGTYNLQVGGTGVWGAGAYVNGSDKRLKKSISTYTDNALDLVNQMRPVTFEYIEDYSDDRATQIGFIAQDLQEVLRGKEYLDGIVKNDAEHLNVAYQSLIPVLTKAIQELTARIEALEAA